MCFNIFDSSIHTSQMDTGTVMTMDYFIEHFHSFIDEYMSEGTKNNVSKFLNVN